MRPALLLVAAFLAGSSLASAQGFPDPRTAGAALLLLSPEPPARILVDPPLAGPLSRGLVTIAYRTRNIRLLPNFGPAAAVVSPRIGHLHVSLDDAPWVWVDASGEPVVVNGLRPGLHKLKLQLESANHRQLDEASVTFTVPARSATAPGSEVANSAGRSAARLVIDPPMAEPLARGVLFVQLRAPGLRILPVTGAQARGASPPIGHLHVTLDGAGWYWEDLRGGPIIINGLAPGPHALAVTLVNGDHQQIDRGLVSFLVPTAAPHH